MTEVGEGPPVGTRAGRPRGPGAALLGAGIVVGGALRLLARHWPTLLTLYLTGVAAREFILIAAVRLSRVDGMLAVLLVVLAPIAMLTAFTLMLRTVRTSLPYLAAATSAQVEPRPDGRRRTLLDHLGSALVPFLAVYAAMGFLKEDLSRYQYLVIVDETLARAEVFDGAPSRMLERLPASAGTTLVSVVVVAVVLRWLLSNWQGRHRWAWLSLVGAYLEVIWMVVVAGTLQALRDPVTAWAQERRIVNWLIETWQHLVGYLGPVAGPVHTAGVWLAGLLASADAVIMVPVAWLAVGAVVYGHRLTPPQPPAERYQRAGLPRPIRAVYATVGTELHERFGPLVHGLRLLARAGLVPMLLFCLAFIAAQNVRDWLWELERSLIGPRDLETVWMPVSGPLSILNEAIGIVLLVCLLAAAVDRVLRFQPPAPPADPATDPATDLDPEPSPPADAATEVFSRQ